jgi:SAM-dependent methyltransferase
MTAIRSKSDRTIDDFGQQWTHYRDNPGYYGSEDLLKDFIGPLLPADDLTGKIVLDVGSGTGRIVLMLLAAGAKKVYGVEPSVAFSVLKDNTEPFSDRVELLQLRGDQVPLEDAVDLSIALGVIHHIPDPLPTMRRMFQATKPGGKCLIWLYGRENNGLYIRSVKLARFVTTRLPDPLLRGLVRLLDVPVALYIRLCQRSRFGWPMSEYVRNVLSKIDPESRRSTIIFDQLNPAYARYYREEEAVALMEQAGFVRVKTWHRHEYSWTVLGEKPTRDFGSDR